MGLTKEQKEALENVAEIGVVIYQKVISESGSAEMAKDIVREYFTAVFNRGNTFKLML